MSDPSYPPYGQQPPYGSEPPNYGQQPAPQGGQDPYNGQPAYGQQPDYGQQPQPPYGASDPYAAQNPYGAQDPYGAQPQSGVPGGGYQVPNAGYPYAQAGYGAPAGYGGPDPLVHSSGLGFSGWFSLYQSVLKRSIKSLLVIMGIAVALPTGLAQIALFIQRGAASYNDSFDGQQTSDDVGKGIVVLLLVAVLWFAASVLGCAGWAGGVWAITQEAATGQPVDVGSALKYGLRKAFGLWGWSLLVGLMAGLGSCLCLLPGIYLGLASSLFAFVSLLEPGQNPIGRSFQLVNRNFGPALGRLLFSVLPYLVCSVLTFILSVVVGAASAGGGSLYALSTVIGMLAGVLTAVAVALMVPGFYLTYLELRAKEYPTTTPMLQATL